MFRDDCNAGSKKRKMYVHASGAPLDTVFRLTFDDCTSRDK